MLPSCDRVNFTIGMGVTASIDGQLVRVGNERYLHQLGIASGRAVHCMNEVDRHGAAAILVAGRQRGQCPRHLFRHPEVAELLEEIVDVIAAIRHCELTGLLAVEDQGVVGA